MVVRLGTITLYFIAVLAAPWAVVLALALVLVVYFRAFISALLGALLFDILYGAPLSVLGSFEYLYTALVLCMIVVAILLRGRLLE